MDLPIKMGFNRIYVGIRGDFNGISMGFMWEFYGIDKGFMGIEWDLIGLNGIPQGSV